MDLFQNKTYILNIKASVPAPSLCVPKDQSHDSSRRGYTYSNGKIQGYTYSNGKIRGYTYSNGKIQGYTYSNGKIRGYTYSNGKIK